MTNEKPILFKSEMVRAILDGSKTQTRRIVKNRGELPEFRGGIGDENDPECWGWECGESGLHIHMNKPKDVFSDLYYCPFYEGLELWVYETFWQYGQYQYTGKKTKKGQREVSFLPFGRDIVFEEPHVKPAGRFVLGYHKRPSIFMPRWASRIQLRITDVRVERLQDISVKDAMAEGIEKKLNGWKNYLEENSKCVPQDSFSTLWQSIHGAKSWQENPWLWVIEFERINNKGER